MQVAVIIIHAVPVSVRARVGIAHEFWIIDQIAAAIDDGAILIVNSAAGDTTLYQAGGDSNAGIHGYTSGCRRLRPCYPTG